MSRSHDVVACHTVEQIGAELAPGLIALRLDAEVVFAVGEVVVVQHDLIEKSSRTLDDVLNDGQMLRVAVAETLPALTHTSTPVVRDTSGNLDAFGAEELDGRFECLVFRVSHVTEGLDIDLVKLEVLRKLGIRLLPVLHRTDAIHIASHDVGCCAEIAVLSCQHH